MKLKLSHDREVFAYTLLAGFPAVVATIVLLFGGDYTAKTIWTFGFLVVFLWLVFAAVVHNKVVRPLQTMANLLSALREGDFSIRGRGANRVEALGDVVAEINTLSATLQQQRLSAVEATQLLRAVMEEIDVAIFAFDEHRVLRLSNPAARHLLRRGTDGLGGRTAEDLGLGDCLAGDSARLLPSTAFGGTGRWGMKRTLFRQNGRPHHLLVIQDLSRTLREEELRAWQRLVRVLGHELNNSLAPIKSIAGSLGLLLDRPARPGDWEQDMRSGLEVIESRAGGLARFIEAYAHLARLPAPVRSHVAVPELVRRAARLETRVPIAVGGGPEVSATFDPAQIEQVLINLLKNAAEATVETAGRVEVSWRVGPGTVEIVVEDTGPGIANPANLFVPFFTTKPDGSGIGLVLSRQIAENHGGSLTLRNREPGPGGVASLVLPR